MFFENIASLDTFSIVFLLVSLGIALSFEFVNGFHDAANAVATVIYTKSMKPNHSVILSGIFNFLGIDCYQSEYKCKSKKGRFFQDDQTGKLPGIEIIK